MRRPRISAACIGMLILTAPPSALGAESVCFGSTGNGRLENGVQLPRKGRNFEPYSTLAASLGRTYVHSKVASTVTAAYASLAGSLPGVTFVYGETGWKAGGRIKPHRTHQNGTSADFMVPLRNAAGQPAPMPRNLTNRYGYDLEFDARGRLDDLRIDFEAVAEHLYALHATAKQSGIGIHQVIFDTQYLPTLFATQRGAWLERNARFMKARPWIRHDEHYHVDFSVACRPASRA